MEHDEKETHLYLNDASVFHFKTQHGEGGIFLSMIRVNHLTFAYEGSFDTIFEDVSFCIDTNWKLGFIGRNGRGKTTFLNLLRGKYPCGGAITSDAAFDYFPFETAAPDACALTAAREVVAPFSAMEEKIRACLDEGDLEGYAAEEERYAALGGYTMDEQIVRETGRLGIAREALDRPFSSLSGGERTKLLIAALFLKKGRFLLIDEPTNHLDAAGRAALGDYLATKKGFILVSHDRAFLDRVVDHILSINRKSIEVQRGNYSSWEENRRRQDQFEWDQNAKLQKDIARLQTAAREKAQWSDRIEQSKIGSHSADRGFVGHQAAKMMKRSKSIERRREAAAAQKEELLQDLEQAQPLKLHPLVCPKNRLVEARDLVIDYGGRPLLGGLHFCVERGQRVALTGKNGCGKSSILSLCRGEAVPFSGTFSLAGGLIISHVAQDVSYLRGDLREFARSEGIDESLFKTILRKLDFTRTQFLKNMEDFSAGQKKKAALAASLARPAHLYLWDEPLNFIDLLSRVQIENLLCAYRPTMLFVEHDAAFVDHVATQVVRIE